jgi:ERCC4-type nuclease
MPIYVDYREKVILRLCPEAKEHTPPVGDIWIGDLDASGVNLLSGGVVLERKTAADLEASILDGRYREQRGRLLAYAQTHNVSIGYVVEGDLDRLGARLDAKALMKHVTRSMLHHKIPVFQTASAQETVALSRILAEQVADPKTTGQFAYTTAAGPTAVAMSYNKATCRDSPDAFLVGVLTQCRGVSEALARIIQKKFPTLEALMGASEADLASAAEGKRKVGVAVAKRLMSLLHPQPQVPQQSQARPDA